MLGKLIQLVEVDIGEKLAGEVAKFTYATIQSFAPNFKCASSVGVRGASLFFEGGFICRGER